MDIGPREKNIPIIHEHSIFVPLWAHPRWGINPVRSRRLDGHTNGADHERPIWLCISLTSIIPIFSMIIIVMDITAGACKAGLQMPSNPTFRRVGHFGLPVHFVAWPAWHGRFKCCPESHSTSAIHSTCLAMFCISPTFAATAFPSPSGGDPHLAISVHISHSITRFPAPSPTSLPESHMLP
jgi:hypothetical protein